MLLNFVLRENSSNYPTKLQIIIKLYKFYTQNLSLHPFFYSFPPIKQTFMPP